jgi:hypothetical protein
VFHFPLATEGSVPNFVVAGSKALSYALKYDYTHKYNNNCFGDNKSIQMFKAKDVDLFILNSEVMKIASMGEVDFIHSDFESVEELLLGYDLPVCRVAYNSHGFWISAHAIAAILTGVQYVSDFASTKSSFIDVVSKVVSDSG